MRRDLGKKLVRREVAVWIGAMGAGRSAGKRDSAIFETLASVAEPIKLEGMAAKAEDTMKFESCF